MERTSNNSVERKFHQAEQAWASDTLYGTIWKCGTNWDHFRFLGRRVDAIRNTKFAKRHFTTYGRYKDTVIQAIAKDKLNPTEASKAALKTSFEQLVDFVDTQVSGMQTFDKADNRALLFYTARKEILEAGKSSGIDIIGRDFEDAFYDKVVHAQVRLERTGENGIDIVRDFDTIVKGIELIGFQKTTKQIESKAAYDFGYQLKPDSLLKIPTDLSLTGGQRKKEEVQVNIGRKAWILVNYSKSQITKDTLLEVLGDDFQYIKAPVDFANGLDLLRTIQDAEKAVKDVEAAWKLKAKDIEEFEKEHPIRYNSGLFTMLDPELKKIDTTIIALITENKPIDKNALKQALNNHPNLVDIDNLAIKLNELLELWNSKLSKEEGVERVLSPLETACIELIIREHFTLDNPIENGICKFLKEKRDFSKINPESKEIRDYFVWGAKIKLLKEELKCKEEEKAKLLLAQQQELQMLEAAAQSKKNEHSLLLAKHKDELDRGREENPVNAKLKTALELFKGILELPRNLTDAAKLKQESMDLLQKAAAETFDIHSGDKSLKAEYLVQNEEYIPKLMKDIPVALTAWIKVEEEYLATGAALEKTYAADLQKIEADYKNTLVQMEASHNVAIAKADESIFLNKAETKELADQIKNRVSFIDDIHHPHEYLMTYDYFHDLDLRLTPNTDKRDTPKALKESLEKIVSPYIPDKKTIHSYANKVLSVDGAYTIYLEKQSELDEKKKTAAALYQTLLSSGLGIEDKGVLDIFVKEQVKVDDQIMKTALENKNAKVAGQVDKIYEYTIRVTWDRIMRSLSFDAIWKKQVKAHLGVVVGKVNRQEHLSKADDALLTRARVFVPQLVEHDVLTKRQADLIEKRKMNDAETLLAYDALLRQCQKSITTLKIRPAANEPMQENPILPTSFKKKKEIENTENDNEERLVVNKNPVKKVVNQEALKESTNSKLEDLN